jgi:multiple sugar transport system permease protein
MTSFRDLRAKRPARKRENLAAYLFLGPWVVGLLVITIGPMIASLFLAFTDYNLLENPEWSGFDNFVRMLSDERLHNSLRVTFTYVLVSVPLQLALALLLAVVLNRGVRGMAFYRSIFYLPSLLGASVAIAILWQKVFGSDGLVNQVLSLFGIQGRGWISEPETALWTLVLQIIHAFQVFTQAFVVSNGMGGPSDSTLVFTLYVYQRGFGNLDMGYASAMAWVLLVIIAAFTAINFFASKYWVFYDD